MSRIRYCSDCRYYDSGKKKDKCEAPQNQIIEHTYKRSISTPALSPQNLNANNNCRFFKKIRYVSYDY